jgi:hypothetical protein
MYHASATAEQMGRVRQGHSEVTPSLGSRCFLRCPTFNTIGINGMIEASSSRVWGIYRQWIFSMLTRFGDGMAPFWRKTRPGTPDEGGAPMLPRNRSACLAMFSFLNA